MQLRSTCPATFPPSSSIAQRMVQVFQNLIENALQHSPRVEVRRGRGGPHGRRWCGHPCATPGPASSPTDLPRLFEPFFTRREGGTGLGLSIAQRSWSCTEERSRPRTTRREGRCRVSLPALAGGASEAGKEGPRGGRRRQRAFRAPRLPRAGRPRGCRGLDLRGRGAAFRNSPPMPRSSTTRSRRRRPRPHAPPAGADAAVPFIVLTGHGSIDLAVQAIKEGAEQFLTKPVELPAPWS